MAILEHSAGLPNEGNSLAELAVSSGQLVVLSVGKHTGSLSCRRKILEDSAGTAALAGRLQSSGKLYTWTEQPIQMARLLAELLIQ